MEPEDLLAGPPTQGPSGAEELRAIVARAGRRRWRAVASGAAVALVAGAGIGYAVSNHKTRPQTVVASAGTPGAPAPSTANPGHPASGSAALAPGTVPSGAVSNYPAVVASPVSFTHVFTRTAGDVTIRGYTTNSKVVPMPALACGTSFGGPSFQAEVSTPAMVGTTIGWTGLTTSAAGPVISLSSQVIGQAEGDPTAVVLAHTSSAVTKVEVAFAGGRTDEMTPIQGWAALAAPAQTPPANQKTVLPVIGTLTAVGSSGQILKTMTVTEDIAGPLVGTGAACVCPKLPTVGTKPGSSGSGSSGSASGSVSSGSVSSGSAQPNSAVTGSAGGAIGAPTFECARGYLSPPATLVPAPAANGAATSTSASH